jgi:tetratricopeptide (TPR) repeat protein
MKENLTTLNETISTNTNTISESNNGNTDFSDLITELTNIKNEGNSLYKSKKIEEAKNKFKEGYDRYLKELPLIKKEKENNEQCKEVLLLAKKILSNLALCYYKQENYKEAINYDLKIIAEYPKFGKSIVRLFNSYKKIKEIQQAVFYGDLFLELDQETRDKFKGTQAKVQNEKQKFKKLEEAEQDKIKKEFAKYAFPGIILLLAILFFLLFKKK